MNFNAVLFSKIRRENIFMYLAREFSMWSVSSTNSVLPSLIVDDMENKWTDVYILFMAAEEGWELFVSFPLFFSLLSLYFYLYLSVFLRCSLLRRPRGKNAFYCETTSFGSSEVLPLSPWRKHKIACRQPVTYPHSSLKFSAGNLFVPLAPSFSSCFETEKFPVVKLIAANVGIQNVYSSCTSEIVRPNHSFVTRRAVPKTKDFRAHGSLLRRAGLRSAKQT